MNWKIEKIFIATAVVVAGILILLAGFKETPEQNYARRLEAFRTILLEDARAAFDNNQRDEAARLIGSNKAQDPNFNEKYEQLKRNECIGIFSDRDVVDFFRDYFVNRKADK
jgi:hypothetical protein